MIRVKDYDEIKLEYNVLTWQWLAEWKRDDVPGYGYGATIEAAITALTEWK